MQPQHLRLLPFPQLGFPQQTVQGTQEVRTCTRQTWQQQQQQLQPLSSSDVLLPLVTRVLAVSSLVKQNSTKAPVGTATTVQASSQRDDASLILSELFARLAVPEERFMSYLLQVTYASVHAIPERPDMDDDIREDAAYSASSSPLLPPGTQHPLQTTVRSTSGKNSNAVAASSATLEQAHQHHDDLTVAPSQRVNHCAAVEDTTPTRGSSMRQDDVSCCPTEGPSCGTSLLSTPVSKPVGATPSPPTVVTPPPKASNNQAAILYFHYTHQVMSPRLTSPSSLLSLTGSPAGHLPSTSPTAFVASATSSDEESPFAQSQQPVETRISRGSESDMHTIGLLESLNASRMAATGTVRPLTRDEVKRAATSWPALMSQYARLSKLYRQAQSQPQPPATSPRSSSSLSPLPQFRDVLGADISADSAHLCEQMEEELKASLSRSPVHASGPLQPRECPATASSYAAVDPRHPPVLLFCLWAAASANHAVGGGTLAEVLERLIQALTATARQPLMGQFSSSASANNLPSDSFGGPMELPKVEPHLGCGNGNRTGRDAKGTLARHLSAQLLSRLQLRNCSRHAERILTHVPLVVGILRRFPVESDTGLLKKGLSVRLLPASACKRNVTAAQGSTAKAIGSATKKSCPLTYNAMILEVSGLEGSERPVGGPLTDSLDRIEADDRLWLDLVTVGHFVHVAGTRAQILETAQRVMKAIRSRRAERTMDTATNSNNIRSESGRRQAQSVRRQWNGTPLEGSIPEASAPTSVFAFFFTELANPQSITRGKNSVFPQTQPDCRCAGRCGSFPQSTTTTGNSLPRKETSDERGAILATDTLTEPQLLATSPPRSPDGSVLDNAFVLPDLDDPSTSSTTTKAAGTTAQDAEEMPQRISGADYATPTSSLKATIAYPNHSFNLLPVAEWMCKYLIPTFFEVTYEQTAPPAAKGRAAGPSSPPAPTTTEPASAPVSSRQSATGNHHLRKRTVLLSRVQHIAVEFFAAAHAESSVDSAGPSPVPPTDVGGEQEATETTSGEAPVAGTKVYCSETVHLPVNVLVPWSDAEVIQYLLLRHVMFRSDFFSPEGGRCATATGAVQQPQSTDAKSLERRVSFSAFKMKNTTPTPSSAEGDGQAQSPTVLVEVHHSNSTIAAQPPPSGASLQQHHQPRSILKSGKHYKRSKFLRDSAPATSVVPFQNVMLWRWLVSERLSLKHKMTGEGHKEAMRDPVTASTGVVLQAVEEDGPLQIFAESCTSYIAASTEAASNLSKEVAVTTILALLRAERLNVLHIAPSLLSSQRQQQPWISQGDSAPGTSSAEALTPCRPPEMSFDRSPCPLLGQPNTSRDSSSTVSDGGNRLVLTVARLGAKAVLQVALLPLTALEPQRQPTSQTYGSITQHRQLAVSPVVVQAVVETRRTAQYAVEAYVGSRTKCEVDHLSQRIAFAWAEERLRSLCGPLDEFFRGKVFLQAVQHASENGTAGGGVAKRPSVCRSPHAAEILHAEQVLSVLVEELVTAYQKCLLFPQIMFTEEDTWSVSRCDKSQWTTQFAPQLHARLPRFTRQSSPSSDTLATDRMYSSDSIVASEVLPPPSLTRALGMCQMPAPECTLPLIDPDDSELLNAVMEGGVHDSPMLPPPVTATRASAVDILESCRMEESSIIRHSARHAKEGKLLSLCYYWILPRRLMLGRSQGSSETSSSEPFVRTVATYAKVRKIDVAANTPSDWDLPLSAPTERKAVSHLRQNLHRAVDENSLMKCQISQACAIITELVAECKKLCDDQCCSSDTSETDSHVPSSSASSLRYRQTESSAEEPFFFRTKWATTAATARHSFVPLSSTAPMCSSTAGAAAMAPLQLPPVSQGSVTSPRRPTSREVLGRTVKQLHPWSHALCLAVRVAEILRCGTVNRSTHVPTIIPSPLVGTVRGGVGNNMRETRLHVRQGDSILAQNASLAFWGSRCTTPSVDTESSPLTRGHSFHSRAAAERYAPLHLGMPFGANGNQSLSLFTGGAASSGSFGLSVRPQQHQQYHLCESGARFCADNPVLGDSLRSSPSAQDVGVKIYTNTRSNERQRAQPLPIAVGDVMSSNVTQIATAHAHLMADSIPNSQKATGKRDPFSGRSTPQCRGNCVSHTALVDGGQEPEIVALPGMLPSHLGSCTPGSSSTPVHGFQLREVTPVQLIEFHPTPLADTRSASQLSNASMGGVQPHSSLGFQPLPLAQERSRSTSSGITRQMNHLLGDAVNDEMEGDVPAYIESVPQGSAAAVAALADLQVRLSAAKAEVQTWQMETSRARGQTLRAERIAAETHRCLLHQATELQSMKAKITLADGSCTSASQAFSQDTNEYERCGHQGHSLQNTQQHLANVGAVRTAVMQQAAEAKNLSDSQSHLTEKKHDAAEADPLTLAAVCVAPQPETATLRQDLADRDRRIATLLQQQAEGEAQAASAAAVNVNLEAELERLKVQLRALTDSPPLVAPRYAQLVTTVDVGTEALGQAAVVVLPEDTPHAEKPFQASELNGSDEAVAALQQQLAAATAQLESAAEVMSANETELTSLRSQLAEMTEQLRGEALSAAAVAATLMSTDTAHPASSSQSSVCQTTSPMERGSSPPALPHRYASTLPISCTVAAEVPLPVTHEDAPRQSQLVVIPTTLPNGVEDDSSCTQKELELQRRVCSLEKDLEAATFNLQQWQQIVVAERHKNAVDVERLQQQLARSHRRSLSPISPLRTPAEDAFLSLQARRLQELQAEVEASRSEREASLQRARTSKDCLTARVVQLESELEASEIMHRRQRWEAEEENAAAAARVLALQTTIDALSQQHAAEITLLGTQHQSVLDARIAEDVSTAQAHAAQSKQLFLVAMESSTRQLLDVVQCEGRLELESTRRYCLHELHRQEDRLRREQAGHTEKMQQLQSTLRAAEAQCQQQQADLEASARHHAQWASQMHALTQENSTLRAEVAASEHERDTLVVIHRHLQESCATHEATITEVNAQHAAELAVRTDELDDLRRQRDHLHILYLTTLEQCQKFHAPVALAQNQERAERTTSSPAEVSGVHESRESAQSACGAGQLPNDAALSHDPVNVALSLRLEAEAAAQESQSLRSELRQATAVFHSMINQSSQSPWPLSEAMLASLADGKHLTPVLTPAMVDRVLRRVNKFCGLQQEYIEQKMEAVFGILSRVMSRHPPTTALSHPNVSAPVAPHSSRSVPNSLPAANPAAHTTASTTITTVVVPLDDPLALGEELMQCRRRIAALEENVRQHQHARRMDRRTMHTLRDLLQTQQHLQQQPDQTGFGLEGFGVASVVSPPWDVMASLHPYSALSPLPPDASSASTRVVMRNAGRRALSIPRGCVAFSSSGHGPTPADTSHASLLQLDDRRVQLHGTSYGNTHRAESSCGGTLLGRSPSDRGNTISGVEVVHKDDEVCSSSFRLPSCRREKIPSSLNVSLRQPNSSPIDRILEDSVHYNACSSRSNSGSGDAMSPPLNSVSAHPVELYLQSYASIQATLK